MINFCHIVPTSYLPTVRSYSTHLLLAHLVEENEVYRNFYINLKKENPNVFYHLDNSAFEMYKRGQPMYSSKKLIQMGKLVNADSVVLSDYPKQHWTTTVNAAKELIPRFKDAGFKTFFVPQSELGHIQGLINGFEWAINNPEIDYIGVSILACPIGLGINETTYNDGGRDEAYRMQRYLSRWGVFQELERNNLLSEKTHNRFHCLGMTDGPREITLLNQYANHIFSWDSSTAVWHGIHKIEYDNSPTGLRRGKFEEEVDFDIPATDNLEALSAIASNMGFVDRLCRGKL